MNAVSGSILLALLLVVCFAPRRWAVLAMAAGVFFLTQGHSLSIAGLSLYPIRILEAAAFGRVLLRRELVLGQLNRIDFALVLLYNYAAVIWILRSTDIAAEQFASALEPTICYLALRSLINGVDDVRWFLTAFVVLLVPFTALVFLENLTGQSSFTAVGASPVLYFREGVARCMGSFRHAITLGSVGATLLCLYIGLWMSGSRRAVAVLGASLCLALVGLSNSGGPLTSAAAVFLGWAIWYIRDRMTLVRRVSVLAFLFLVVFMRAPIWYLPFKISELVGGGGYHRGVLMERAWHDLGRWWLVGMDIRETASWFPYVLGVVGGADMTNQFLLIGIRGGLPALGLLVCVIVFAFKGIGRALSAVRPLGNRARGDEAIVWALGATLFVHTVTWFGVSYFDQSYVIWLMQLAMLSSTVQTLAVRAPGPRTVPVATRRSRSHVVAPSAPDPARRTVASRLGPVSREPRLIR